MPRSVWDRVPDELKARIAAERRVSGAGPDRLFRQFRAELAPWGVTSHGLRSWLYRSPAHGGEPIASPGSDENARRVLDSVASLLERSGIDPTDVARVRSIRVSDAQWQGLTKNAEGEAEIHDLKGERVAITLVPSWDQGPRWELVDRAPPIVVKAPPRRAAPKDTGRKRAVILPDVQIGFWRDLDTGDLIPFHDEAALGVALDLVARADPDVVVLLGDMLDLAPLSDKFAKEAGFVFTAQATIDRGGLLLAEIRARVHDDTRIVVIEGNHDRRLQKLITMNALEAFGLRRANATPDDWPVMSVPFLLRMDELGVEYVGGYPAGAFWLNDNLVCIHGHKVRSTGSTAAAVIDDERVSVIFGHIHRIELQHKTRRVRAGARSSLTASPGCLCRIDGVVPSTKGATDPMGRPVPTVENWQQGVAVVDFEPGDGRFSLELVPIHDGWALWRGDELAA